MKRCRVELDLIIQIDVDEREDSIAEEVAENEVLKYPQAFANALSGSGYNGVITGWGARTTDIEEV